MTAFTFSSEFGLTRCQDKKTQEVLRVMQDPTTLQADAIVEEEGSLRVFTAEQFRSMDRSELRQCFARHNILVLGGQDETSMSDINPKDWNEEDIARYIDLDSEQFVNGASYQTGLDYLRS